MEDILMDWDSGINGEQADADMGYEGLVSLFMAIAKHNLRIVIDISSHRMNLRTRLLNYPGLLNECTIDWFEPWPHEALFKIAEYHLSHLTDMNNHIIYALINIYESVEVVSEEHWKDHKRRVHVNPKSYISYVKEVNRVCLN